MQTKVKTEAESRKKAVEIGKNAVKARKMQMERLGNPVIWTGPVNGNTKSGWLLNL